MQAVWWRTRIDLRRQWVSTLVLILLVGLLGSVVIAAAAGARRTSTAPDRLVTAAGGEFDTTAFDVGDADPEQVRALPQVEASSAITFLAIDGQDPPGSLVAFAADDPTLGGLLVEGSAPDPDDPLAATIDEQLARQFGVGVGDELVLASYTPDQFEGIDVNDGPGGPSLRVRVAAVLREPDDISPADPSAQEQVGYAANSTLYLPTSFLDRYGDDVATVNTLIGIRLARGPSGLDDFFAAVRGLPAGDTVQFFDEPRVSPATQRAVDVQSLTLLIFAAALGLVGALVVGQALSRQLRADRVNGEILAALGSSRAQRVGAAVARGAVVGVIGALLAAVGAIAWSPLTPIGLARQVEPRPGVDVNTTVIVLGAASIVVMVLGWAVITGWSAVRRRRLDDMPRRRPSLASRAAQARARPPLVVGLSLAGGQRTVRPTAWALAGVTTGFAAFVAASLFLATLDGVVASPERYGWTFDAVGGSPFEGDAGELGANLVGAPGLDAIARSGSLAAQAQGRDFGIIGIEAERGIPVASIETGRQPLGPREVALGGRTLRQLGLEVGGTVEVDGGGGLVPLAITGTAVVPEIGAAGAGFGEGGVVTLETFGELASGASPSMVLLDLGPSADVEAISELRARAGGLLLQPVLPTALYDVQRVRGVPVLLAALLGLLAVAALAYHLFGLVRSGRHDIAVLKAIGFVPRQVGQTVAWVATAFGVTAVLLGLPLGIALGQEVWRMLADRLGVGLEPVVPVLTLLLLIPAALLVANGVALVPARLAARAPAGEALRIE